MCPKETVAAVTALATLLVEKLGADEGAYLAALFTQLGDTMASLIVGNELCCKKCRKQ